MKKVRVCMINKKHDKMSQQEIDEVAQQIKVIEKELETIVKSKANDLFEGLSKNIQKLSAKVQELKNK